MEKSSQNLSIPVELLGLENIEIIEVKMGRDDEIFIKVKSTKDEIPCRQCGKPTKVHGMGRTLKIRHLPILGKKTFIEITPMRGICDQCDDRPSTTQTLSWYDHNARHTKAYEQYILLSIKNSTITDASIKEDISEGTIQNILNKYIDDEIDWNTIKKLGILGIDEISLKKGYKDYITIITSRISGKNQILAVLKGRDKTTVKAFFNSIPEKLHKTIIAICCDMYDGYVNAASEVFDDKVAIVVDRFHVAKLYRKSLVSLRQQELSRLRKTLSKEEYESLKTAIAILVKKQEKYTKQDKKELEKLFEYSPALKAAYRLARQLTAIYNTKHRKKTADKKLTRWIESVHISDVRCFDGFIETLKKYQDYVINYFIDRNTSGFVEGLNNKFKVTKRRCYGISNLKNFFQRIFLDLTPYYILKRNQFVMPE